MGSSLGVESSDVEQTFGDERLVQPRLLHCSGHVGIRQHHAKVAPATPLQLQRDAHA